MQKKLLAVAIAAIGAVGSAQASAVAQSVLQVTNFKFFNIDGTTPLDNSQFDSLTIVDTTNLNPTMNPGGTNPFSAFTVGGAPLPLNVACVPGTCAGMPSATPFANAATPAPVDGAMAASSLDGTPVNGIPGLSEPFGANARTSSLAERVTTGSANTSASLTLATLFSFVPASDLQVVVDFDAVIHLLAFLDSQFNATAGTGWNISITNPNAAPGSQSVFDWTPNGQAGGISGGTEQTDDCGLTNSITAFGPVANSTADCSGHFRATTGVLLAANTYNLSITHQTQANVLVSAVPEPGALALAAIGLIGLGAATRRRRA